MLDRLADAACHTVSLAIVAVAATLNVAAAVMAPLFAAEVNDGVLAGLALFVLGTGTGIVGWALVVLVRLTATVARLEGTTDDHERRLGNLEPRTPTP